MAGEESRAGTDHRGLLKHHASIWSIGSQSHQKVVHGKQHGEILILESGRGSGMVGSQPGAPELPGAPSMGMEPSELRSRYEGWNGLLDWRWIQICTNSTNSKSESLF